MRNIYFDIKTLQDVWIIDCDEPCNDDNISNIIDKADNRTIDVEDWDIEDTTGLIIAGCL